MLWRLAAWYCILELCVFGALIGFYFWAIDFREPGMPVDWKIVPKAVIPALWWVRFHYWVLPVFAVTLLAPRGFFRRSNGRSSRWTLGIYVATSLLACIAMVAAPLQLYFYGYFSITSHTSVIYGAGDVWAGVIVAVLIAAPALAALWPSRLAAHPTSRH